MSELHLHVPFFDELWYRKQLMEDPATMNYNRGYDLPYDGYDPRPAASPFPNPNGATGTTTTSAASRIAFMLTSSGTTARFSER